MAYPDRFKTVKDELEWLYMELYGNREMLLELEGLMAKAAEERKEELNRLDERRLADPRWFVRSNAVGETMYTNLFAGTFNGLAKKVDYLKKLGITYLHLMPSPDAVP